MNVQQIIPLVDLKLQHSRVAEGIKTRWDQIFENTSFILGSAVSTFETEFSDYSGVESCVGVANGGDAIELALRALDIKPGDEVLIPANTFAATAMAVQRVGAVPIVVDVDPVHQLLEPDLLEPAITSRTRAIIAVHLFGQIAPMGEINEVATRHGIPVIEDAAQCQGATQEGRHAGSFGLLAATSFYPGKNLGAYGDGGAILTNDSLIADRLRRLRNYGGIRKYEHEEYGYNSRLDSLQAAVLSEKLCVLDQWNRERQEVAATYCELLEPIENIGLPSAAPHNQHVWHLYVVQVDNRDQILAGLNSRGIGAGIHYPVPIHKMAAFANSRTGSAECPVAEGLAHRILSLPIFPGMTREQVNHVCKALIAEVAG